MRLEPRIILTKELFFISVISTATLYSSLGMVPLASAQPSDGTVIEEIVVRALKRDQTIYEAPVSITAFSHEDLQILGTQEIEDYARLTPNMNVRSRGGRRLWDISIRGVAAQAGVSTTYGIYLDEFNISPTSISAFNNPSLQDAAQVEILRGPQGVYFGRSILAGSINITTNKPTEELAGDVSVRVGSNERYQVRGAVGGPIIDGKLGFRAVAYYEEFGGFMNNIGPADVTNDFDEHGTRLALRYTPTDRTTVDFAFARVNATDNLENSLPNGEEIQQVQEIVAATSFGVFSSVESLAAAQGTPFYPASEHTINVDESNTTDNEASYLTLRAEHELDGFSLIAVAGYMDGDNTLDAQERDMGLNETPYVTPFGAPATYVFDYDLYREASVNSHSIELRLQSNGDGALQWVIGAFYAEDEETQASRDYIRVGTDLGSGSLIGLDGVVFETLADVDTIDSRAVFGDISYAFLDGRLTLSAGARYSRDTFSSDGSFAPPLSDGSTMIPLNERETEFSHFAPTLTASYEIGDSSTVYLKASNAYRPGGFNDNNFNPEYDEETLWNYELGLKGRYLNNRLSLRTAAFVLKWDDMQVGNFTLDEGNFVSNAAEATIEGAELEAEFALNSRLSASIGIGYTDAEFDDFPNATLIGQDGIFELGGTPIPYAPEWNLNAATEYRHPLSSGAELQARAELQYLDEQFTAPGGDLYDARQADSYTLVNLRLGYHTARYSLMAFAENLSDEVYELGLDGGIYSLGGRSTVAEGRRFGVRGQVYF